jgi:hypothetical protein
VNNRNGRLPSTRHTQQAYFSPAEHQVWRDLIVRLLGVVTRVGTVEVTLLVAHSRKAGRAQRSMFTGPRGHAEAPFGAEPSTMSAVVLRSQF